ncbi:hypothetical protein C8R44DRAFT_214703 [Mycena epipterygia]|nr:hypothetical protein C8R44DRAFT_214703 [Mycena epipterygia]
MLFSRSFTLPPPRNVVALSLLKHQVLYDLFSQLLDSVRSVAILQPVDSKIAFRGAVKTTNPEAVLVVDAAITYEENTDVLQQLIRFARAGGIVVCCSNFSNNMDFREADVFFSQWRLPWDAGSYFRTAIHLNSRSVAGMSSEGLSASYSVKSLSLVHIGPAEHTVYNPSSSSLIESHVFESDMFPVDPAESPCAYAPVGRGYFGYVGDVNSEEDSTRVVLAMVCIPPTALLPPTSAHLTGLKPMPDGTYAPTSEQNDPNSQVMFSDARPAKTR